MKYLKDQIPKLGASHEIYRYCRRWGRKQEKDINVVMAVVFFPIFAGKNHHSTFFELLYNFISNIDLYK